jgi:hypothetical protein
MNIYMIELHIRRHTPGGQNRYHALLHCYTVKQARSYKQLQRPQACQPQASSPDIPLKAIGGGSAGYVGCRPLQPQQMLAALWYCCE